MLEKRPENIKLNSIENVETRKVFGNVNLSIYGRNSFFNERGGSLTGLNSQESFSDKDKQPLLNLLKEISEQKGIKVYKAPIAWPRHNGKLKTDNNWKEVYSLSEDVLILKGENYEGCEIKKGEAFIMSPADCMTIVLRIMEKTYVMHAGRDSMFDVKDPSRLNIVESILSNFPGINPVDVKVWAGFGVAPGEHFIHDEEDEIYGEQNKARRELLMKYNQVDTPNYTSEGHIDLQNIFYNMCIAAGIKDVIIDKTFYTYSGKEDESRKYYSHTAGDKIGRNLVVSYLE